MTAAIRTAALLLLAATGAAADTLLLRGATVHRPGESVAAVADVLIRDGTIDRVAPAIADAADTTVDLAGLHLYPGLIATDTSLGLVEIPAVRASVDNAETGRFTPEIAANVAVNPDSESIPVARAGGITHFVATPTGGIVAGRSSLMAARPWTIEDMTVQAAAAMHLYWPSMALRTAQDGRRDDGDVPDIAAQDRDRRRRIDELTGFFRDAAAWTAGPADAVPPAWAAMKPVLAGEMSLAIHADTVAEIRAALAWSEGQPWRIAIAGGRDAWRLAPDLARRGIPVIYDHVFTLPPRDSDPYDVQFRAPAVLYDAGVPVAIGAGDFRPSAVHNLPFAAAQAIAHGLPESAALAALTSVPAAIFGAADRAGDIRPGMPASLIAVTGSLFDIRQSVRHCWIDGKPMPLDSRHTRLYERYRGRPPAGH